MAGEVGIDFSGLDDLLETLQKAEDELPKHMQEFHRELGADLEKILLSEIGAALHDENFKIQSMQTIDTGHSDGYAKARPKGSKEGAEVGKNGPGAITQYLESGHAISQPRGGKRYNPHRIHVPFVAGRHFYGAARSLIQAKAIFRFEEVAEKVKRDLEG